MSALLANSTNSLMSLISFCNVSMDWVQKGSSVFLFSATKPSRWAVTMGRGGVVGGGLLEAMSNGQK